MYFWNFLPISFQSHSNNYNQVSNWIPCNSKETFQLEFLRIPKYYWNPWNDSSSKKHNQRDSNTEHNGCSLHNNVTQNHYTRKVICIIGYIVNNNRYGYVPEVPVVVYCYFYYCLWLTVHPTRETAFHSVLNLVQQIFYSQLQ